MPTLEERRRATAKSVSAGRAATGEAARRATGRSMIEDRTGKAVVADINRLTQPQTTRKTLRSIAPVGALPPSRGRGEYKAPPASTGGGIAGPLAEKRTLTDDKYVPDREYWPGGLTSSDGLFILPAIKTLKLIDANGDDVEVWLANPEGTIE